MRFLRSTTAALVLTLTAGACTASDAPGAGNRTDLDPASIDLTAGLARFESCDALLDQLIAEGLERVGPYGFGNGYGPVFAEMAVDEMADDAMAEGDSAAAASSSEAGADGAGGQSFTDTNVQELGVDEPDIIKTDGSRMVAVGQNQLVVLDVTGSAPEVLHRIELGNDYWVADLFLHGDRAFVTTSGWTDVAFSSDAISRFNGSPTTRIAELDLESGAIIRTFEFEGSSLSAREVGGTIRFVLSAGSGQFPFVFPSNPEAEAGAEAANRATLEASSLDQWLPSYRILEGDTVTEQGRLLDCDRMYLPEEFSGFGAVAVLSIDADNGLTPLDAVGVLTDGQTIYASPQRLTVATQRWPEWSPDGQPPEDPDFSVKLHSFDITEPVVRYTGSGAAPGHLLNQYSLSEYDGYLRVATTVGDPWSGRESSESMVTVFQESSGSLVEVGRVGGLGKGEQIQAVRFLGPIGYVVTFRQVDPLYTIDLSDPTDPTVRGELKITGYSAYLHPLPDGRLLGVGQAGDEEGRILGSQASLFDVSNLDDPTKITGIDFGENSTSSVEWDARAFTWWAEEQIALIPISWWDWDERTQTDDSGSAVVLVKVEGDTLTELGRVGHGTTEQCESEFMPVEEDFASDSDAEAELSRTETSPVREEYCWSYAPEIRRAVVVGSTLYTLSEAGVMASDVDGLDEIDWIPFQR